MSEYGVEIYNGNNQIRLESTTATTLLVAVGTAYYSGSSSTYVSVPAVSGSGTTYGVGSFRSSNTSEYATITMPTQSLMKIDWWSGATSNDFVVYAVYHR